MHGNRTITEPDYNATARSAFTFLNTRDLQGYAGPRGDVAPGPEPEREVDERTVSLAWVWTAGSAERSHCVRGNLAFIGEYFGERIAYAGFGHTAGPEDGLPRGADDGVAVVVGGTQADDLLSRILTRVWRRHYAALAEED